MTPYYDRDGITLYVGDSLDVVPMLEPESISAVITDPPYGLGFMGKAWDHAVPGVPFWQAFMGVMKPGAHLAAFGGSRTYHRMGVAIEDAGLELRDTLMWLYGSGFPKSHDVSKAIDKAAGAEREVVGYDASRARPNRAHKTGPVLGDVPYDRSDNGATITAPATPQAQEWAGWGTALKPAHEPIILARKPLSGTVAANVLAHGTGALNIDASRIGTNGETPSGSGRPKQGTAAYGDFKGNGGNVTTAGRWPSNVILDEDAAAALDRQSGERKSPGTYKRAGTADSSVYGAGARLTGEYQNGYGDTGGASRFFYVAKASRKERNAGLDGMPEQSPWTSFDGQYAEGRNPVTGERTGRYKREQSNHHPTVKPLALMRYLITLVTPPGGIVLDPFAGSGTTLVACAQLGIRAIGVELTEEYAPIIAARIDHAIDERLGAVTQPALEMVAD